jgi:chemotaxis protein CheD
MALVSSLSPASGSRLDHLKAQPRKPGEASFFFYDAHFRNDAVKILPGEYFVHHEDLLINEMMKRGASRMSMEAKVFGGGQVVAGMNSLNVGERNTNFVIDYLKTERIPIMSKDVLDIYPRKVCFLPASGKAMVKRLAPTNAEALVAQDRAAAQRAVPASTGGGSVDLF